MTVRPSFSGLPAYLSSFVGREQELGELARVQLSARLVTLVGPGGVGKTRLAVHLAAAQVGAYRDGVRFIDPESAAPTAALVEDARAKRMLVILDGCERDVSACAELATRLLNECAEVRILATSQQPLHVGGEVVWRVSPLSLRSTGRYAPRDTEASRLFRARAAETHVELERNARQATSLARLCRQLDGLPLALEIVADHAANLGVNEIAARMQGSWLLDLQAHREAPPRQRTLRSSVDWSYALLTRDEALLLRCLCVFVDPWSLEAAMHVCAIAGIDASAIPALLDSLVDKSLVVQLSGATRRRFRLLNVTRWYGLELLQNHGELSRMQQRHLEWYVNLAESVPPQAFDVRHAAGLERERHDIRAALDYARAEPNVEVGLRLATAAFSLWFLRSRPVEGQRRLEELLALADASVSRAVVLAARVWCDQLKILQGSHAAAETDLRAILREQRARGDQAGTRVSLLVLGNAALWRGALRRARQLYERALAVSGDIEAEAQAVVQYQFARVAWETGDLEAAARTATQLLGLGRARSHLVAMGRSRQVEALLASSFGDHAGALRKLGQAEAHQRRIRDEHGLIDTALDRGHVLLTLGRSAEASQVFGHATALAQRAHAQVRLIRAIEGVACALASTRPLLGVQLASAMAAARAAVEARPWPRDKRMLDECLKSARRRLGRQTYLRAWQQGTTLLDFEATTIALSPPAADDSVLLPSQPQARISQREREVVRLFASGASTHMIAERLVLSPTTVRTHLDRVMSKLQLHSRVQLVAWAARSASLLNG